MISIMIYCDNMECSAMGKTYTGHNPMEGVPMKKLLQFNGWSFRGPIDTDEGTILCPKCFKASADEEISDD